MRKGFTILELLVFAAIFTVVAVVFVTILVSFVRIQTRQSSVAEVDTQSQFVMQLLQQQIQASSLVDIPSDTPTTTLKLRMASSTTDPTSIYLSGGVVYLQQTSTGTAQPLTSSKVSISNLTFTKHANTPGHDTVDVALTVTYNASSAVFQFTQGLDLGVTRVSAATFDSNVLPSTTNSLKIGASGSVWQSINDTIYFSGSNVGIGAASPGQTLEVNGGIRINTTNGQPTCNSAARGTFWVVQNGTGVKDNAQVCVKNASDTYTWAVIY